MKNILFLVLALAIVLCYGCSFTEADNGTVQYDENEPLFICQDRADIEGDRNTFYYYNHKGELLKSQGTSTIGFYAKNGLAPAYDKVSQQLGYVDKNGKFIIEPQWDSGMSFSDDGIARVMRKDKETGKEKFGYIDDKGKQIVSCIYDTATSFFPKGVAIVGTEIASSDGYGGEYRYGVINTAGKVIVELKYDSIAQISGPYIICCIEDTIDIYDLSGDCIYSKTNIADSMTEKGTSWYYYSYYYDFVTDVLYCSCTLKLHREDGTIEHTAMGKSVFDGERFVDENDIENNTIPKYHSEKVAGTVTGYAHGLEVGGEIVIPCEYDTITKQGTYYLAVRYKDGNTNNGVYDIYDAKFEKTAEDIEYNFVQRYSPFGEYAVFPDGFFEVNVYDEEMEEWLSGVIDHTGKIIVPCLYYRNILSYTYECIGGDFGF